MRFQYYGTYSIIYLHETTRSVWLTEFTIFV